MSTFKDENILQQVNPTCPAVGYQRATVCVPVTVTPFATVGNVRTFCCGAPTVTSDTTPCPGTVNGSCVFKITQAICVAVPVAFGARAVTGSPSVVCGTSSATDICTGCTPATAAVTDPAKSEDCAGCK